MRKKEQMRKEGLSSFSQTSEIRSLSQHTRGGERDNPVELQICDLAEVEPTRGVLRKITNDLDSAGVEADLRMTQRGH